MECYQLDSLATLATAAISSSTAFSSPVTIKKDLSSRVLHLTSAVHGLPSNAASSPVTVKKDLSLLGSSPIVSSSTDSAEAVANIKMELQSIKQVICYFIS